MDIPAPAITRQIEPRDKKIIGCVPGDRLRMCEIKTRYWNKPVGGINSVISFFFRKQTIWCGVDERSATVHSSVPHHSHWMVKYAERWPKREHFFTNHMAARQIAVLPYSFQRVGRRFNHMATSFFFFLLKKITWAMGTSEFRARTCTWAPRLNSWGKKE
jgi:hypothetical protein